jgi:hypothetical protein
MANKDLCEETLELLLVGEGEHPEHIKEHISCCEKCKTEYEKILKIQSLINSSMPDCPNLKDAVLEKINSEKIKIAPEKKKHRFPIGTISAAAAVLVVYISIYGTGLSDFIFENTNDALECEVADEEIVAEAEEESAGVQLYRSGPDEDNMMYALNTSSDATLEKATFDKMESEAFNGAAMKDIAPESEQADPAELFEKYSESYPDRISLEDVEKFGWSIYCDFIASISDAESEYTLENFMKFAQK